MLNKNLMASVNHIFLSIYIMSKEVSASNNTLKISNMENIFSQTKGEFVLFFFKEMETI